MKMKIKMVHKHQWIQWCVNNVTEYCNIDGFFFCRLHEIVLFPFYIVFIPSYYTATTTK